MGCKDLFCTVILCILATSSASVRSLPFLSFIEPISSRKSDTKGTFHAKMGLIKDRNGMDLTEAEDIKKRWQEHTEELYKKSS